MTHAVTHAVALAPSPLESPIGQTIDAYRAQLEPFLRDGLTLERVAAELVLASHKTPNLDKVAAPLLVSAVCRAIQTGGVIGDDVYLVPFKNSKTGAYEPTVMLNYRFKAALAVMAGAARSIDARPVWSDESFEVDYGTNPSIRHAPLKIPLAKRQLVGAYAVAFMGHNHAPKVHWMPLVEIEAIRARSKEWNPGKVVVCPPWYACARVVHQLVKLLPQIAKLGRLLGIMEEEEREFNDAPLALPRPAHVTEDGEDLTFPEAPADGEMGEVRKADRDAAWACSVLVPFGDDKGKPLGEITSVHYLQAIIGWASKQREKPNGYAGAQELEAAAEIRLELLEAEG